MAVQGYRHPFERRSRRPRELRGRLGALKTAGLWRKRDGLYLPGIHWQHGVVTPSAAALADHDVLSIVESACATWLGAVSFVVFPKCLVTITWPPRLALGRAPTPAQVAAIRDLPQVRESELVYFNVVLDAAGV